MTHPRPIVITLSNVTPTRMRWLWHGRIGLGKLTMIEGPPGVGKSSVMLDIAARVSQGRDMPDGSPGLSAPADVLIAAATEDGTADTIVPRLMAADADLSRVHEMTGVTLADGTKRPMDLNDLSALAEAIRRHEIRYVLADAFMALIPANVNAGRDPAMRRVMTPLAELADECGVAIILNRHHRKAPGTAIDKGGESVAIGAVARSVLVCGPDPSDDTGKRMVLAVVKNNLVASGDRPSWAYELRSVDVDFHDGEKPANLGAVEWIGASSATAEQVSRGPGDSDLQTSANECGEMVRSLLADGPRPAREVQAACRDEGFSPKQIRGARERMKLKYTRDGFGGGVIWALADSIDAPPDPYMPTESGATMDSEGMYALDTNKRCKGCGDPHIGIGTICEGCL